MIPNDLKHGDKVKITLAGIAWIYQHDHQSLTEHKLNTIKGPLTIDKLQSSYLFSDYGLEVSFLEIKGLFLSKAFVKKI